MRRTPRLKDHHSFGIATLLVRPAASAVKSDSENVHQRPRANMSAFYHLLIHLPIEQEHEERWCLWRPDHAGFDSRSIFEGALIEE
jgi:hypothetical protein